MINVSDGPVSDEYEIVTKVGSISFDHELQGRLLEIELDQAKQDFIHYMELAGFDLWQVDRKIKNPDWVRHPNGEPKAWYAMDWEGNRPRVYEDGDGNRLPTKRERSLEDSHGEVEYRIVGAFWSPKRVIEVLTNKQDRLDTERALVNPVTFGPILNSR